MAHPASTRPLSVPGSEVPVVVIDPLISAVVLVGGFTVKVTIESQVPDRLPAKVPDQWPLGGSTHSACADAAKASDRTTPSTRTARQNARIVFPPEIVRRALASGMNLDPRPKPTG